MDPEEYIATATRQDRLLAYLRLDTFLGRLVNEHAGLRR